jgi:hypothetical protein
MATYSFYDRQRIQTWSRDPKRKKITVPDLQGIHYISELSKVSKELGRTASVNYFLLTRLGITDCRNMIFSARKQRDFCYSIIRELQEYGVDPKYYKVFDADINSIKKRSDFIYRIVQENLKLTEYWPYFEAVGFNRLLNCPVGVMADDGKSLLDPILPEMEAWMKEHSAEIDSYMEKVKPEIERKKAFKERNELAIKEEKKQKKAEKKRQREEQKQALKIKNAERIRRNKINKEFETTLQKVDKYGPLYSPPKKEVKA